MKTTLLLLTAALAACALPVSARENEPRPVVDTPPPDAKANKVQIALLLDTSNSMDGLIDQARTQLWNVVNSFTEARRDGQAPFVEVALYEYGNNGLSAANNWIRQVQPMSRDLDGLSKSLFSLKTNGGEEYCGAVIERALSDLTWDRSKETYKVIFIAGNEPFTQGPVDPRQACRNALSKGVVVNTIHCGTRQEGIAGSWHDGAALGGGRFMVIDQDKAVVSIPAPQDKKIADLGIELNKTYIPYGKDGAAGSARQQEADKDAAANVKSGASQSRAGTKASANYSNVSWDLVDAWKEKKADPAKIDPASLPPQLRDLKPEERTAYVEKAAAERAAMKDEILKLTRERDAYVAEERKKQAASGEKTLDEAMVEASREQASAKGYTFTKP